jgi:hypothetical protein
MPNEADRAQIKRRISDTMEQICKDVEKIVLTTNERKYVYKAAAYFKHVKTEFRVGSGNSGRVYNCLKELLEAIKNTFPDCTIIVDPLETYIVIDWS